MFMKSFSSAALLTAALAAGSAQAASLVSNHEAIAKSANQSVEFEFLNDADVYGIEFDVVFAKGVTAIDTSNCLGSLDKGFGISRCAKVADDRVRVMVLSAERLQVPNGVVAQIGFDASKVSGEDVFVVENAVFGSRGGISITPDFVDRSATPVRDSGGDRRRQYQQER
jgi:opacity protein-like surface antigen